MNDEINRNILMTKTILWKAVIHLKRYISNRSNKQTQWFEGLVNEEE